MTSERECYVYIVPPGATEFVTAGRFRVSPAPDGDLVGQFVYGRRYLERDDAVELDPLELRLRRGPYETARMQGFFGAIRDSSLAKRLMPMPSEVSRMTAAVRRPPQRMARVKSSHRDES